MHWCHCLVPSNGLVVVDVGFVVVGFTSLGNKGSLRVQLVVWCHKSVAVFVVAEVVAVVAAVMMESTLHLHKAAGCCWVLVVSQH